MYRPKVCPLLAIGRDYIVAYENVSDDEHDEPYNIYMDGVRCLEKDCSWWSQLGESCVVRYLMFKK